MSAFWNNIKFPFFDMQSLNLDWILMELKRISGFMPQDGSAGEILMRTADGAAWEPLEAIDVDIKNLPEDTEITDNDQLIFYDISAQANRKIKPPNLLDSMMSNGIPLMDGTGSPGTSKKPARYDHKHPTDTSRQAALSGAQMAAVNSGAAANSFNNGVLDIAHGGTGGLLDIAHGGTNATTAEQARANIGALDANTVQNWNMPANTDLVLNLSNGARFLLYTASATLASKALYIVNTPNAGGEPTYAAVLDGTSIQLTPGTNTLTLRSGGTGAFGVLVFNGSVSLAT